MQGAPRTALRPRRLTLRAGALNAAFGWGLAALALAVGIAAYGWRGAVMAISVIVFWLLLQFTRSLRALRDAAGRPVGDVESAVMAHARLHEGMRLVQILKITRSLGRKLADAPETFEWSDAGGDSLRVELDDGRLRRWRLERAAATSPPVAEQTNGPAGAA